MRAGAIERGCVLVIRVLLWGYWRLTYAAEALMRWRWRLHVVKERAAGRPTDEHGYAIEDESIPF